MPFSGAIAFGGGAPVLPLAFFIPKTAAYTLTLADSGKYIICSGGSWTLTLPTPAVGLNYRLRNDQGISGTTGTITLQPTGGTVEGATSLALLPQQECTLITDGTNWRTFGLKREVILGTQDTTSAVTSAFVLLPEGYRYFELNFDGLGSSVVNDSLWCQVSFDGGATWATTNYTRSSIYNSSATTVGTAQSQNTTQSLLGTNIDADYGAMANLFLNPGSATNKAAYISEFRSWSNTPVLEFTRLGSGFYNAPGLVNAFKYYFTSGNITEGLLTVKGIV
jgi:hypothetical protein